MYAKNGKTLRNNMKRLATLFFISIICCLASAQVYYYVPREIDPGSSPNLPWQERIFVGIKDANSNLWFYMIQGYDEGFNSLTQLKEALLRDPNAIQSAFNNSTYHRYDDGREVRFANDEFYKRRLTLGCWKANFKQQLSKCYVYKFLDTEISISLDYNTFVLHSNSATPRYYKRCYISDFKLRKSADDLF